MLSAIRAKALRAGLQLRSRKSGYVLTDNIGKIIEQGDIFSISKKIDSMVHGQDNPPLAA